MDSNIQMDEISPSVSPILHLDVNQSITNDSNQNSALLLLDSNVETIQEQPDPIVPPGAVKRIVITKQVQWVMPDGQEIQVMDTEKNIDVETLWETQSGRRIDAPIVGTPVTPIPELIVTPSISRPIPFPTMDSPELNSVKSTLDYNAFSPSFSPGSPSLLSVPAGMQRRKSLRDMTFQEALEYVNSPWEGKFDPSAEDFDLVEYFTKIRSMQMVTAGNLPEANLLFKNVTVVGQAMSTQTISTVLSPILACFDIVGNVKRFMERKQLPPKVILENITGYARDGEMVFVLGRPGSGCSSLLRTLAGLHNKKFGSVTGTIAVNGMELKSFMSRFPGQVSYSGEDDAHYPNLLVGQTLDFALRCRFPMTQNSSTGENATERMRRVRNLVMRNLGISHTADTKVGNEIIRGVSGGERKRVSIAEQMIVRAAISLYDGSTKGLDSASALKFVQALKTTSRMIEVPVLLSCYQASEAMYVEFSKVLLLSRGHCIYFGAIGEAKKYFTDMGFICPPRQTTPDFLTSVTELMERQIQPGYENLVPKSAQEFAARWQSSHQYQEMLATMSKMEQDAEDKARKFEQSFAVNRSQIGSTASAAYPTNFFQQLYACLIREYQLMWGNKLQVVAKFMFSCVMALIVGSTYFQLPLNGVGAYSRGGVLFFALLFNSTQALSELPEAVNGRAALYKHRSFHLYRASAFYVAKTIAGIPVQIFIILVFSSILYWLVGLNPLENGARFFTFYFTILISSITFTALVRCIGTFSPNLDAANRTGGIILILLLLFNGYLIRVSSIPPWFIWIPYINPLAYGLRALLANEFRGLVFECSDATLVPNGPGYEGVSIDYKACTIPGSNPGTPFVSGTDYLMASYSFSSSVQTVWQSVGAMFGFYVLYVLVATLGTEFIEFGKGGSTTNVFKRIRTQEAFDREDQRRTLPRENLSIISAPPFTWTNLNYYVPVKGGTSQLLHGVNGKVVPGRMIALMGASGAGKTTLLDTLALRKTIGKIEGQVMVGNVPQDNSFRRRIGYAEQMDVHMTTQTVREALRFSAMLRQDSTVSKEEKYAYVEEVIRLLEMENIADAMIGTLESGLGISMEERKRLTIGVELVAKPAILFLDEPTSGLDSNASFNIIRLVRNLANHGQAIICTIHQPAATLFEFFDDLLLLARGGKTVYCGPIGQNSSILKAYFERYGAPPLSSSANPAEWILQFSVGSPGVNFVDWPQVWIDSPESKVLLEEIQRLRSSPSALPNPPPLDWWTTFGIVLKRQFVDYFRLTSYNLGRIMLQIAIALILGLSFFRVSPTLQGLQLSMFALYQCSVLGVSLMNSTQPQWFVERTIFYREASSGFYGWFQWALALTTAEVPYVFVGSVLYSVIYYFMVGFNPAPTRFFFFLLMYFVFSLFSVSLGQAIAAFAPVLMIAALITPLLTSNMSLFAGVTIPATAIPVWFRWINYIDPYRWFLEGVLSNALHELVVTCLPNEFTIFTPPPNQTCGSYANPFVVQSPGYLNNPSATTACQFCPIRTGDAYLEIQLGWSYDYIWISFAIILLYVFTNRILAFAFVRWRGIGGNR